MLEKIKHMKLKLRFILLILLLTSVILVQNVILISDNSTIISLADNIAEKETPFLNKAHELKLAVVQVQQWLTDISATRARDGLNDGFDEAENNAQIVRKLIAELSELDPVNKEQYQHMLPTFEKYYEVGKKMAQAYIDEGPSGGNQMMANFDEAAVAMSDEVDNFLASTVERTNTTIKKQQQIAKGAKYPIMVGITAILVTIGFMYYIFARIALARLPLAANEMKLVASGQLNSQIKPCRNDEIGELMHSFEGMRKQLSSMVVDIRESSVSIFHTAEKITTTSETTSANSQRQQTELESAASALQSLSTVVQEIAQNSSETANAASAASDETTSGKHAVEVTIQQINSLSEQITNAVNVVMELEKDSANITAILDVIKDVADQTNLLALNAAIEAARAGDQGRGFAVVADEVRTLAQRTQNSTDEINAMIEQLQSRSRKVAEAMQQSHENAKTVVEQAESAGIKLETISQAVDQIMNMTLSISSAVEEQNSVANEISQNIEQITTMANTVAEDAANNAEDNRVLNTMASKLEQLVSHFKV